MTKILIYNWIPFDEKELKGGGVTIYTRNLIEYLCCQTNVDVYFLSSGRTYNKARPEVYIEPTENEYMPKCKSYRIVNSPVMASAYFSFAYPEDYLYDEQLKKVLKQFFAENRFDVVHYQNLEGLSLSVHELKLDFPNTRFIYSVHNYFPICPQVMLWERNENNCIHTECGEHCVGCMPTDIFKERVMINQHVSYQTEKQGVVSEEDLLEQKRVAEKYANKNFWHFQGEGKKEELINNFRLFKIKNVEYLNKYFDEILAVSQRVAEILVRNGVDSKKIKVNYIGTKVAEKQLDHIKNEYSGGVLKLCYLGYMRHMKGFFFLLDALESMPYDVASKIAFTFATPITDSDTMNRIDKLRNKLADVKIYGGYTHEQLGEILANIHMGVVPPLWEDNLPQVAIEMKAHGVTVLSSDLGGAKELTRSKEFVFKAGDVVDFIRKVKRILDNPDLLQDYWKEPIKLATMEAHMEELLEIYEGK